MAVFITVNGMKRVDFKQLACQSALFGMHNDGSLQDTAAQVHDETNSSKCAQIIVIQETSAVGLQVHISLKGFS